MINKAIDTIVQYCKSHECDEQDCNGDKSLKCEIVSWCDRVVAKHLTPNIWRYEND